MIFFFSLANHKVVRRTDVGCLHSLYLPMNTGSEPAFLLKCAMPKIVHEKPSLATADQGVTSVELGLPWASFNLPTPPCPVNTRSLQDLMMKPRQSLTCWNSFSLLPRIPFFSHPLKSTILHRISSTKVHVPARSIFGTVLLSPQSSLLNASRKSVQIHEHINRRDIPPLLSSKRSLAKRPQFLNRQPPKNSKNPSKLVTFLKATVWRLYTSTWFALIFSMNSF